MDREILYRGKRVDNGEWVTGDRVVIHGEAFIYCACVIATNPSDGKDLFGVCGYKVDPTTRGEYTGLKDRNGKRIFEGDIVRFQFDNDDDPWPHKRTEKHIGRVFWQDFRSSFAIAMGRNGSKNINNDLWKYVQNGNRVEVIGNIHDNPELLKEEPNNGTAD